jgi:hypothetical protein
LLGFLDFFSPFPPVHKKGGQPLITAKSLLVNFVRDSRQGTNVVGLLIQPVRNIVKHFLRGEFNSELFTFSRAVESMDGEVGGCVA